ncbi:hypothetical protein ACGO3R_08405 [Lactococcus lactis]
MFSTEKLELEELALAKEVNQVSSLIEDCVNENSRVALEQTGYENAIQRWLKDTIRQWWNLKR